MNEELNATYDAWSETYDTDLNIMVASEGIAMRSLFDGIEFNTALDAATGTGRHAIELASRGAKVYAFDVNAKMLAVAEHKVTGQDVEFRTGCLPNVPWKNLRVDLVVCALALAHIEKLEDSISNLSSFIKVGGSLLISDVHPRLQAGVGKDFRDLIAGERRVFPQFRQCKSEYIDAFKAAGLSINTNIDIPVDVPGAGIVPGLCVFHCIKHGAPA